MAAPLSCMAIARAVGSIHKCNKKTVKRTGNKYTTYSTKNPDDIQLLWALLCKKRNARNESGRRLSRRHMDEVEREFGATKFCMCKFFTKNIRECIRIVPPSTSRKRKPESISEETDELRSYFTLDESDDSDTEYACSLLHNHWSSPEDSFTSAGSAMSPTTFTRRRSPRNTTTPVSLSSTEDFTTRMRPSALQFRPRKRRKKTVDVLEATMESVGAVHKGQIRKRFSQLSSTVHTEQTMTTLCHLLYLAGYKSGRNIRENSELYEDIDTLLISVKSLLMKLTGLTDKVAQNQSDDLGDDEVLSTLGNLVSIKNDPKVDEEKKRQEGVGVTSY